MYDSRFQKMAQVIVNYSIAVKPGQMVYIWSQTPAAPLMLELYKEVLKAGGNAFMRADIPGAQEILLQHGSEWALKNPSAVEALSVEEGKFDAYIRIGAETNTRRLTNADPDKMQLVQTALRPSLNKRMERSAEGTYNWCVTLFPTDAYAMDSDMSLADFTEFVFAACMLNDPDPVARWKEMGVRQQVYVDFLNGRKRIDVKGPNVDLTMSIDGRIFKNSQGLRNFPDGEIFTGPVEDSVNGWIRYDYPCVYQGREVQGVELTFEHGRVTKATAKKGEDFLLKVLDTDYGARTLGEFAIGTNYGITKFSRNILFDEKIGGTMHMAVGSGYPDTGAKNKSAVHWDMIAGMQNNSTIAADGDVFYKDGKFVI